MSTPKFGTTLYATLFKIGVVGVSWVFASQLFYQNWGFLGVQEWIDRRILHRRAQRLTTCPECSGSGNCQFCDGKGCAQCHGDGRCNQCHGEGNLVIGSGSEKVNG